MLPHKNLCYLYCKTLFLTCNVQRNIHASASAVFSKHYDPKFRKLRAKKVIKITLPDFDEVRRDEKLTPEEMRSKLKEKGITPSRQWSEKPLVFTHSAAIFDAYVPPEGDGKISIISRQGLKQHYDGLGKKGRTYLALRRIRNFQYDFDVPTMGNEAQNIYIEAHRLLAEKDQDKLHDFATEKCIVDMLDNASNKTIRWKYIQSLELPRVVHIRCEDVLSKNNVFAQATVRLHTQQTLALYDRFGRLMHGSEDRVKDVLEYVVFEKYLTNAYGKWRMHAKIIPDWMPPRENITKTFRKPPVEASKPEPATDATEPVETTSESDKNSVEPVKATTESDAQKPVETTSESDKQNKNQVST